jgi:hypothetical protein
MVKMLFALAFAFSVASAQEEPGLRAVQVAGPVPHGSLAGFKPLDLVWPDLSVAGTNTPDGMVVAAVSMTIAGGKPVDIKLLEGIRPYTRSVLEILQNWKFDMPTDGTSPVVFNVGFTSENGRIVPGVVEVQMASPPQAAPVVLYQPAPVYPTAAVTAGVEGTVDLRVSVHRDGTVSEAEVVRGPELLRQFGIDAAMQFRFETGSNLPRQVDVSVAFRLPAD